MRTGKAIKTENMPYWKDETGWNAKSFNICLEKQKKKREDKQEGERD